MEYNTFLIEFNNIVGFRSGSSNSTKFTYLKTYLKGYALKVINHLQVNDVNYPTALTLLEGEFLNKESLIEDLFAKLLSLNIKSDVAHLDTKLFINEVRCVICDLKSYDVDLLKDESSLKFLSHIVFSRLPVGFKKELVHKLDNNYPTLIQVFDNYAEVMRTLNLKNNSKPIDLTSISNEKRDFFPAKFNKAKCDVFTNSKFGSGVTISKTKHDLPTDYRLDSKRICKFCNGVGHSMFTCRKYGSHETRISRCRELRMCEVCTSVKHQKDKCLRKLDYNCTICQSNDHVSAMSPKFKSFKSGITNCCISSDETNSAYLLSTITVKLSRGKAPTIVRCLYDPGSQRSYTSCSGHK